MGWMWSSQSPSAPKAPNPTADESNNNTTPAPPPKQPESDYGDPEIAKFMAQLQAEFSSTSNSGTTQPPPEPSTKSPSTPPSTTTTTTTTTSQSSNSSSLFWSTTTSPPSPTTTTTTDPPIPSHLDPITESLLPTSMSCRQAFDAAYHCNSLGGQWVSVYRTGTMRSCSEHWDDFWFCMRTRTYSGPQKEDAIRAYYRRKEYLKYHAPGRPSSEDVWQPRDDKVRPDTAFREHLDMPSISDEEWRRLEIERRRKVQEQLQSRES